MRIVTYLGPQEALDCAISLQQPLLARTQAILTHGSSTAAQGGAAAKQLLQHLAQELQLMAVLIKGMEMPGPPAPGSTHPAMKLLEAAWPALSAVAEAPVCQRDADVVQALCEVYKVRRAGQEEHMCELPQHAPRTQHACGPLCLGFSGVCWRRRDRTHTSCADMAQARALTQLFLCCCCVGGLVLSCLCVAAALCADVSWWCQAAAGDAAQGCWGPVCGHAAGGLPGHAGDHHRGVWRGQVRTRAGSGTAAGAGRWVGAADSRAV